MIDQNFCELLEYKICEALKHSENNEIAGFWCDGVLLSQSKEMYSQAFINANRKIILKAFIGKDGQDEYELILKFGNKALSRHARHLDIIDCLPRIDSNNWFDINTKYRQIEIQLD